MLHLKLKVHTINHTKEPILFSFVKLYKNVNSNSSFKQLPNVEALKNSKKLVLQVKALNNNCNYAFY